MDWFQIIVKIIGRIIDRIKMVDTYGAEGFAAPPKEFYQGTPFDPSADHKQRIQETNRSQVVDYGSLIGGIGSLLGGAGSLFGGGSSSDGFSQKGYGQWFGSQMATMPSLIHLQTTNQFKALKDSAKQQGYHPLAVLGQGSSMSAPAIVGQSDGGRSFRGFEESMHRLGQALNDIVGKNLTPYERTLQQLNLQERKESVIAKQLANDISRKELEEMKNPPAPAVSSNQALPGAPGTEIIKNEVKPEGNPGTSQGHNPAMQWFSMEENGRKYWFQAMSDRFADATEEDPITKFRFWKRSILNEGKPDRPPQHVKLKPGYIWSWKVGYGWTQVKDSSLMPLKRTGTIRRNMVYERRHTKNYFTK